MNRPTPGPWRVAPLMLEALENLENDDGQRMPASAWKLVLDAIDAATGRRPDKEAP